MEFYGPVKHVARPLRRGQFSTINTTEGFQGQQIRDITVDAVTFQRTAAFESGEARNDKLARWGLFYVALVTATGAVAQSAEGAAAARASNMTSRFHVSAVACSAAAIASIAVACAGN